jgi:hypothetical protein
MSILHTVVLIYALVLCACFWATRSSTYAIHYIVDRSFMEVMMYFDIEEVDMVSGVAIKSRVLDIDTASLFTRHPPFPQQLSYTVPATTNLLHDNHYRMPYPIPATTYMPRIYQPLLLIWDNERPDEYAPMRFRLPKGEPITKENAAAFTKSVMAGEAKAYYKSAEPVSLQVAWFIIIIARVEGELWRSE